MSKRDKQAERVARLMPGGIPRYVRVYDNGGKTMDRYTIVFTGRYPKDELGTYFMRHCSTNPYHPQGVGISDTWRPPFGFKWSVFGKRVKDLSTLPIRVRESLLEDYCELWNLGRSTIKRSPLYPFNSEQDADGSVLYSHHEE
jgi:hypothetical protein